jgi:general secretion pathway protein A
MIDLDGCVAGQHILRNRLMYEEYWKLSGRPFENRIDEACYYPAETHQAAVLKLRYAIENRRAAAMLCGPGGVGKTQLIDIIASQLGEEFDPVCRIVFPIMDSEQLVRYVADQVDESGSESVREMSRDLGRLERFLKRNLDTGKHAVLFVDEAHLLERNDSLETLRLLLNLAADQANGEAAWTLVLVGQPTLLSQVERYHALDERLSVKCLVNRFALDETTAYIQHRLQQVGGQADLIFEESAVERLHNLAEGIPRRINRLCDLAMMVAYAEDREAVTDEVVDSVHGDLAAPTAA